MRNPTRPQTLHREERDKKVACWWMKFYTDIAKMKERHPNRDPKSLLLRA